MNTQKFNIADDSAIREKLKQLVETKPLEELANFISTEVKNQTRLTEFHYEFTCFREDGAYALFRAVNNIQGYSQQGKDGPSAKPPKTIDVKFADGSRIKVPWGNIQLPNMGDGAELDMSYDPDDRTFYVMGTCEKRYIAIMDSILLEAERIVEEDSIYKGQAFKMGSELEPEFINLSNIENIPMYLSAAARFSLQPIEARLENPEVCKENGLDLKFGALMEGDYGTGKTLLAFKLALKATKNDWTFIYLTDPTKTEDLLKIAGQLSRNGSGVLIFVEDIDLVLHGGRDKTMNLIFNLLDGGDTKNKNIISIFTTNHLNKIDPTFLRGKRIGSLISLGALDKDTAKTFIKGSLGSCLEEEANIETACEKVEELQIVPAFLAEILERVKANMIYSQSTVVTPEQIEASIDSYKAQMDIAKVKSDEQSPAEILYAANQEMVRQSVI